MKSDNTANWSDVSVVPTVRLMSAPRVKSIKNKKKDEVLTAINLGEQQSNPKDKSSNAQDSMQENVSQ